MNAVASKNSVPRALAKTLLLMFIGLFLFGIAYNFAEHLGTTHREPLRADLVGRYAPDEKSIEAHYAGNLTYQTSCYLELHEDGAYEAVNLPRILVGDTGKWKVGGSAGSGWFLILKSGGAGAELSLRGQSPPYSVRIHTNDDPDANEYVTLVRSAEQR